MDLTSGTTIAFRGHDVAAVAARRCMARRAVGVTAAAVTVLETVTQGDRVAVRFVLRGTAAGRTFQLPIANFFAVRDGLIVRDDGGFDDRGRSRTP